MRAYRLLVLVVALAGIHHAAAFLKVSIQGKTVDLGQPLTNLAHLGGRSGGSGGSGSGSIVSLLCPVTNLANLQVTPFPIKADDVCGSFGLNVAHNDYACLAFGQLGSTMANPSLRCSPDAIPMPAETDPKGVPIPHPLPDRRGNGQLPQSFSTSELLPVEGATYSWLHSHVQRIYTWALCSELGNSVAWQPPPGWQFLKMVHIANNADAALQSMNTRTVKASSLPMMAILKQDASKRAEHHDACMGWASNASAGTASNAEQLCNGGHMLFVIRGTATPHEWVLDYSYSMRPDANYGPGRFHSGFLDVANQLWEGGMKQALDQEVLTGNVQHITITGHSLGGASTTLLSARAQAYLNKALASQAARKAQAPVPRISAVTFGGPNVGDAPFAAHFNGLVNARHIQFVYDIISQVPCGPQIAACSSFVPVPTPSAAGAWQYQRTGGQLALDAHMPVQPEVWSKLAVFTQQDFCADSRTVNWNVDALHYCSYMCKLGAYAGNQNWCKLWPEEADKGRRDASYCFHGVPESEFPKDPVFPFNRGQSHG